MVECKTYRPITINGNTICFQCVIGVIDKMADTIIDRGRTNIRRFPRYSFSVIYITPRQNGDNIFNKKSFPILLVKGCYTPPDLYIIANTINIILYNLLLTFLDVLFHKGIIRIAGFINGEQQRLLLHSFLIKLIAISILAFLLQYDSFHKQIDIFVSLNLFRLKTLDIIGKNASIWVIKILDNAPVIIYA